LDSGANCQGDSISDISYPGIERLGHFGEFQDSISSFMCSSQPSVVSVVFINSLTLKLPLTHLL